MHKGSRNSCNRLHNGWDVCCIRSVFEIFVEKISNNVILLNHTYFSCPLRWSYQIFSIFLSLWLNFMLIRFPQLTFVFVIIIEKFQITVQMYEYSHWDWNLLRRRFRCFLSGFSFSPGISKFENCDIIISLLKVYVSLFLYKMNVKWQST